MTKDIDDYYGVTVRHGEHVGPRLWRARAQIFRRDTFEVLDTFFAEGSAMSSADLAAINEAERRVTVRGIPQDWKGTRRGS